MVIDYGSKKMIIMYRFSFNITFCSNILPGPRTPGGGKAMSLPTTGVRGPVGLAAEIVHNSKDLALPFRLRGLAADI